MTEESNNDAKTALITGATVGIGYEFSKLFARDGYNLVLVARDEQRLGQRKKELEDEFGIKVNVIPRDLARPEAVEEICSILKKAAIHIDALVNNAGFGALGEFSDLDLKHQLDMIQLNISALTALTGRFLADMQSRGSGQILNVASTAAFQPGPRMAVYYATKAYVLFFSEALAYECKGSGIVVTTLCPGPTATEFQERAGFGNVLLMKANLMSAEKAARIGYRGLQRGKSLVIPGIMNNLLAQGIRFFPRKLVIAIAAMLQKNR